MRELTANIIHLKGAQKSADGLEKVIYATDTQVSKIVEMRNDPDRRSNFVKIANTIFSPMDIARIDTNTTRPSYDLPKYFLDRYEQEESRLIKIN